MMKLMDLYQSIALTEEIAMEHYNKLNGQFDYNLPGVCNHYFAKYDGNNERTGEIVLTCRVAKTVKGQVRSTYQFDYNLPGVCNHYFAKYDGNNERTGEIVLTCRVAKTVKGQVRSTYQIDGKRIAKKHIDWKFLQLGGCQ